MSSKLYDTLLQYSAKKRSSFHTPGHKGKKYLMPVDILDIDLTEIPDTDNLLFPKGDILYAEEQSRELFGASKTLFSSFGCSLCIQTMLKLALPNGGKIISDRNIHHSAINTMALLDIEPIWIYPDRSAGKYFPGRIDKGMLDLLLKNNRDAKAVYITAPNYYGVIYDIKGILDVAHKYGVPVLMDNAHGSHLYFDNSGIREQLMSVDMVCCSLHKTLPVMTGGAVLNINNPRFCDDAKRAMRLFASTSPSFPILASIDKCIDYIKNNSGEVSYKFHDLKEKVLFITKKGFEKGFIVPYGNTDKCRLSLSSVKMGISADKIADNMRDFGIEPEFSDGYDIVFIPSIFNDDDDFMKLQRFIENFDKSDFVKSDSAYINKMYDYKFEKTRKACSLRKALLSECDYIPVENTVDKIVAESICVYPPGIPILLPGEIMNAESCELCKISGITKVPVVRGS